MSEEPKTATREGIISWLSCLIGGWNASPPIHWGRLQGHVDMEDDEAIARYLLKTHEHDAQRALKEEVTKLKAQIFDLQNKP